MVKALLNGIMKMVTKVINLFLLPINTLFANIFPNMSNAISSFTNFVNTYLGNTLGYFFSLLPPIFRSILTIWFTFIISYYGIYYSYLALVKIWGIIQKLKFW